MASAYDFTFETIEGKPYALRALAGRPLVVVNTASQMRVYAAIQGAGGSVEGLSGGRAGGDRRAVQ